MIWRKWSLLLHFFFVLCNFPQLLSSTILGMTLKCPAHDTGPWPLYKGWQGKSLFYWVLYFSSRFLLMQSWPRTGWLRSKNNCEEKKNWEDERSLSELHYVFLILCEISEQLQYAPLTKLVGQFIEVDKSHFFQWLENLVPLFYNILKKWRLISPFEAFTWKKNVGWRNR